MKWKLPPEPKIGDRKTSRIFALIPIWMTTLEGDDYCVWLEDFQIVEELVPHENGSTEWIIVERQPLFDEGEKL